MIEVAMGEMDMEDNKVADMVLKFPCEDFTDVTVAIGDTCTSKTAEFSEKFRRGGSSFSFPFSFLFLLPLSPSSFSFLVFFPHFLFVAKHLKYEIFVVKR